MHRRTPAIVCLAASLLALGACSRSPEKDLQVGHFHLRLVPPDGWEHLDHGREQIFREGETRISLAEFAPASSEGTEPVAPDSMAVLLFEQVFDARRLELYKRERRTVHGAEWIVLDAWNRVTHSNHTRLACVERGGYLLVLRIDRGPIEQADPVFEQLLGSIEFISAEASAG